MLRPPGARPLKRLGNGNWQNRKRKKKKKNGKNGKKGGQET